MRKNPRSHTQFEQLEDFFLFTKKIEKYLTFYRAYERAKSQEILGDFNLASRACLDAIALKSDFIEINMLMIRVARKNRKYGVAMDFIDSALRKFPTCAELYAQKAEMHRKFKEYEYAIGLYGKAIEYDGQNVEYYKTRAQLRYYTGDLQGAIYDYNYAINNSPEDASLYAQRGFYHFEKKNYESAVSDYTKALELKPESKHYLYMRGASNIFAGNRQEGGEDIKNAGFVRFYT